MKEDLLSVIEDKYEGFSKTNKQLARYIRGHTNTASFLSIKEMEAASSVSAASISRFAKEIGCRGYADLAGMLLKDATPMWEIIDYFTTNEI